MSKSEAGNPVEKSVAEYARRRPNIELFSSEVKRILHDAMKRNGIRQQTIDARAKTIHSFEKKCKKENGDGTPKYIEPLREITDLAGVRVIVFTLRDVERVCKFIEKIFDIQERKDVGEERLDQGKFGYQSIHYLIEFSNERIQLPEFATYRGMICEIQVRTIMQHSWAEIEHDIQYKTEAELPASMRRKFLSLAGLLEIADREFQSIQNEDEKLRNSIAETLQGDITRDAIGFAKQNQSIDPKNGLPTTSESLYGVRTLIRQEKYSDAIDIYDQKIRDQPNSYTLYLGRAKAKFLSGLVSGALSDIEKAKNLNSNDNRAESLERQIKEGDTRSVRFAGEATAYNQLTQQGNQFLENGDGVSAYEFYSNAQEAGASKPFSIYNRAMACVVAQDYEGAKSHLGYLDIRSGTPMEVNIRILYSIIRSLSDDDQYADEIEALKKCLDHRSDFVYQLSPIHRLEIALKLSLSEEVVTNKVIPIIDLVRETN